MKQLMLLERDDLKQLQGGGTISLTLSNGQMVMLGYADAKVPKASPARGADAPLHVNGTLSLGQKQKRRFFTEAEKVRIVKAVVKGKSSEAAHAIGAKHGASLGRIRNWFPKYAPKGFKLVYRCAAHRRRFRTATAYGTHINREHRGG